MTLVLFATVILLQQKGALLDTALVLDAISANIPHFPIFVGLTEFFIVLRSQICGFI